MKQKILAWIAAIAIVAAVSAAFLRPVDINPDFGHVARVYTPHDEIALGDLEGDVDLLRLRSGAPSYYGLVQNLEVELEATRDIAFTRRHYENGVRISGGDNDFAGSVERWENGEWVYYSDMYITLMVQAIVKPEPSTILTLGAGEVFFLPVSFDLTQPGHYRLTYYFRELLADNGETYNSNLTTGEELYSVSHTVTIPEPSDKPFDLAAVHIDELYSTFWHVTTVSFAIRSNLAAENYEHNDVPVWKYDHDYIGGLYLDSAATRLEKRVGLVWTEAPARPGQASAVDDLLSEDSEHRYVDAMNFDTAMFTSYVRFYAPDDAVYRLTLEFAENADGSGERYVLTIDLDLSKE